MPGLYLSRFLPPAAMLATLAVVVPLPAQGAAVRTTTGDLLVTELMPNPAAIGDSAGEWFELFNAGTAAIDLNGLTLSDDGSNSHEIDAGGPLLLAPGEYLALANSDSPGFAPGYRYSGFTLGNGGDQVVISDAQCELTRLEYDESAVAAGMSIVVDAAALRWAHENTAMFGAGDFGTPGAANGPYGEGFEAAELSVVPVPAAAWLFGSALGLLAAARRRLGAGGRGAGQLQ